MRLVSAGYMPVDVLVPVHGPSDRTIGGTSGNVGLILAFLGWSCTLAGQIGDDVLADEFVLEARLAGAHIDHLWRAEGAETVRIVHRVDNDGHNYSYTCPACHKRFPRSRPLTLDQAKLVADDMPSVDVFFFDRVNAATVWLAEHYAQRSTIVAFEPSLPSGGALFERACNASSLIKRSIDIALPIPDIGPGSRRNQVRVVTDGANGLTFSIGNAAPRHLAAFPTLSVDTAGAGDWTTAGLLYHAVGKDGLQLERVEEGLRVGQALAAMCCSVVGARSLMRLTRRTILRRAAVVLAHNALESTIRVPPPRPKASRRGHCPLCALPT